MRILHIVWLTIVFVCPFGALAADELAPVIPRITTPPEIDGRIEDAAWRKALRIGPFAPAHKTPTGTPATSALAAFDKDYLYVAFECTEPSMATLKRRYRHRDDYFLDDDDCVEFFVDPSGSGKTYYHFGVNPNGAIWDTFHMGDLMDNADWDAEGVRAAAAAGKDRWTVEMRIPFADIGGPPAVNAWWRMNFARERRGGEKPHYTSNCGVFCRGSEFSRVAFDLPGRRSGFAVKSVGALTAAENNRGGNAMEIHLGKETDRPKSLLVTVRRIVGKKREQILDRRISCDATGDSLRFPYRVRGVAGERLEFHVRSATGRTLFQRIAAVHTDAGRFTPHPDPLYGELLSDGDPGLAREGLIFWPDQCFTSHCKPFCTRYAIPNDATLAFQQYADHALIPVNSGVIIKGYRFPEFSRRMGVRACVWPDIPKPTSANPEVSFLCEPWLSKFRTSVLKTAECPHLWGIFWGDEIRCHTVKQLIRCYEGRGKRALQKYVRATMNEEVKKKLGYGKYGMPQGTKDTNPFRWIAWFRYVNHRFRELHVELRKQVGLVSPHIRFVSDDPVGVVHPYEYSARADAGDCDVYNHQTSVVSAGPVTKVLADLTGKDVWPVVHFEHYFGSFRPDQVREILSRVFRNGGTGFVMFPADCTRGETYVLSTPFSAPERWNAALEIADCVRRQPKLQYPKPDFGVYYSNIAHQAASRFLRYPDEEIRAAHAMFGPKGCKAWFRFVDENVILNHRGALDSFKALIVPYAKYQLPGFGKVLRAYAERGGVLICLDPEGFAFAADGTSTVSFRSECFGVQVGDVLEDVTWMKVQDDSFFSLKAGTLLPVFGEPRELKLSSDVRVLATFKDGRPAVVRKSVGKGYAVFFAFNPLHGPAVRSREWRGAFRNMLETLGVRLDQDIWRFTFPPFERDLYPKDPKGVCLTNNYCRFENDLPLYPSNVDTQGSYRLGPIPDAVPDQGGKGHVPFAKGDLTDRNNAYAFNAKKTSPNDWQVAWKSTAAVAASFDFKRPYPLSGVRIFYSGQLPPFTVQTSQDGRTWKTVAERDSRQETDGLRKVVRTFPAETAQHARIMFAERTQQKRFDLIEVEVWAENAG